jgi:hypothetical protein
VSKIAIEGNASGTGTLTIAAPNTNTNHTLALPDEAGTVLTSVSSLPAANLTGSLPAGIGGKVLQVVQHTFSNLQNSTSSSSYVDTGVTGSITPTSASSKILVVVSGQSMAAASTNGAAALKRGSTVVADGISWFTAGSNSNIWFPASFSYLDSPATTSSTTYTVQIRVEAGTNARWGWGTASTQTMVLMEIAA